MIDHKSCDKLIELLDKGDLKKLRKYIIDEDNKYYVANAREKLRKYLRRSNKAYYDNFKFTKCNLVLTDNYSVYFLKSNEILTTQRKRNSSGSFHQSSTRMMDSYEKFSVNQEAVEKIVNSSEKGGGYIKLKTKDGKMHIFSEEELSFAEAFLGEDVEYCVSAEEYTGGPVCLVKSKKGTGFILGIKNNIKQS